MRQHINATQTSNLCLQQTNEISLGLLILSVSMATSISVNSSVFKSDVLVVRFFFTLYWLPLSYRIYFYQPLHGVSKKRWSSVSIYLRTLPLKIYSIRFPLKICTIYFHYGFVPVTVAHGNLANTDVSAVTLPTSTERKGRVSTFFTLLC